MLSLNALTKENERPLLGLTVFVVEDQFLIGLDIEAILREAGADVLGPCVELVAERTAATSESFSVAILDYRLGKETTQDVAGILVSRSIPFVYYTGQTLPGGAARALVLSKPASTTAIVQAITAAMRRPGPGPD